MASPGSHATTSPSSIEVEATPVTSALPELERLAVGYGDRGLRPLIDERMEMIVMDCPRCRAQDTDPLGLYRPVRVVPRRQARTILCTACGQRDEQRLR